MFAGVGSCYKVLSAEAEATNVHGASRRCAEIHPRATLISVHSAGEQAFVSALLDSERGACVREMVDGMVKGGRGGGGGGGGGKTQVKNQIKIGQKIRYKFVFPTTIF